MNISKQQAITIAAELDAAVAEVLQRHGLEPGRTNTTYGSAFTWRITASPVALNDNGINTQTPEAQTHIAYGELWGFSADREERTRLLGATMIFGGKRYTYLGANARAHKRPLIFQGEDGRRYSFTPAAVPLLAHDAKASA